MPRITYVHTDGRREALDLAEGTSVMQGAVGNGIDEGLARHLSQRPGPTHTMRFPAVAATLGRPLLTEPAYTSRHWWANDRDHTQARNGWLAAGWLVEAVDLERQLVTFRQG